VSELPAMISENKTTVIARRIILTTFRVSSTAMNGDEDADDDVADAGDLQQQLHCSSVARLY